MANQDDKTLDHKVMEQLGIEGSHVPGFCQCTTPARLPG